MTIQTAAAHGESANLHFFAIFVSKDIYATRERAGLFSHVKSGKFSSGESRLTFHTIELWRGLLLIWPRGLPEPS